LNSLNHCQRTKTLAGVIQINQRFAPVLGVKYGKVLSDFFDVHRFATGKRIVKTRVIILYIQAY